MDPPLISHPTQKTGEFAYQDWQLTDRRDLRLTAHSGVVANRAARLFDGDQTLTNVVQSAATLHDFGKATPQFQAYVRPDQTYTGPETEKRHARLGALATWWLLQTADVSDRDKLAATLAVARHHQALPNAAQYTAETLARAIEQQDGAIQRQLDRINGKWPDAATELLSQCPIGNPTWESFYSWTQSTDIGAQLRAVSAQKTLGGYTPEPPQLPQKLYDRMIHIWSAITLADKTHAMGLSDQQVFDIETLDRSAIEKHVSSLRASTPDNALEAQLNDERERARRQAMHGVHEWINNRDSQIATITLPTGLGKTFTGITAAFEARNLLSGSPKDSSDSTVIYALPYTSIIEQTRNIFESDDLWGVDPTGSGLTVHHYLSETVVQADDQNEEDTAATDAETAELLGEAWRDGTILTTFVQLFESLTGPTNRQSLKLSSLESSIVILDEPQALPKDWWDGIDRLLELLTSEYNAHIIAMTATQPTLIRNKPSISLLSAGRQHSIEECQSCKNTRTYDESLSPRNPSRFFETANRVQYTIHETALSRQTDRSERHIGYSDAADEILDATANGESSLAVCNTIGSSVELSSVIHERPNVVHLGNSIESVLRRGDVNSANLEQSTEMIADQVLKETDCPVSNHAEGNPSERLNSENHPTYLLTLNSRYRPFDRNVIIELADRLSTAPVPFVLVSTQVVEAGVDLSFRTVFRDVAPIDSIVQAAGRCNRSYEWGEGGGNVIVWMLADPEEQTPVSPSNKPPAYYVYEQGSTDAGIPGHLRLISRTLADLSQYDAVPEEDVSRELVTTYFEELSQKSLWSGELREQIDNANSQWLSYQSLIDSRETVDLLVGVTESDKNMIKRISEQIIDYESEGYDRLQNAAPIRISVPVKLLEEAPHISRIDHRNRGEEGVQVFYLSEGGGLNYDLVDGGLQPETETISSRFTI